MKNFHLTIPERLAITAGLTLLITNREIGLFDPQWIDRIESHNDRFAPLSVEGLDRLADSFRFEGQGWPVELKLEESTCEKCSKVYRVDGGDGTCPSCGHNPYQEVSDEDC